MKKRVITAVVLVPLLLLILFPDFWLMIPATVFPAMF
jgi:hypothetical protein